MKVCEVEETASDYISWTGYLICYEYDIEAFLTVEGEISVYEILSLEQ